MDVDQLDRPGRTRSGRPADRYEQEYPHEDEHEHAPGPEFEGGFLERTMQALRAGLWQLAIRFAILGGQRDENKLANMIFFARHPGRGGRPLHPGEPGFKALSAEWRQIRDRLVRPALRALRPQPARPAPGRAHGGTYPDVNTPLPASGPGFFNQHSSDSRRFGLPETIQALKRIGSNWHNAHPMGPRIEIRDISRPGGGPFSPHKSHRVGLDVDVRLLRNDGREGTKVCYWHPAYSRPLTQELVDVIRSNRVLAVKAIGFCDAKVRGVTCKGYQGHNCHMHVRFCVPAHYRFLPPGDKRYSGCR